MDNSSNNPSTVAGGGNTTTSSSNTNNSSSLANNIPINMTVGVPTYYKNTVNGYLRNNLSKEIHSFISSGGKKTGFTNLDSIIGFLYPGLYVLGAGSSLGKTTFLLQMADQLIDDLEPVLYFTMEQSQLELVTKSLSRRTALGCRRNPKMAKTAIQIRKGEITQEVKDAVNDYVSVSDIFTIIQGDFQTDMAQIEMTVDDYIKTTGQIPVIMVDYLQIVQEDTQVTDKAKIDMITKRLKILQRKYNAVVIVISSINRSNYMLPIDFESFKESGSIEYSADVVWGLQLQILNDQTFTTAKNVSQRRKLIAAAKAASPRKVELVCLKNRYGIASYNCGFLYYPQYDLFTADPNFKSTTMGCPTPQLII